MKLVRSVPIILVIILALTAFDSPRAAAQTDCARTPIDMSTMIGAWPSASDCHSPNRPIDPEGRGDGIYYAVYYDFRVSRTSEVTITLESSTDTYLYLLTGAGRNGNIIDKNDDIDYDTRNLNSRITMSLEPGNYSIEATTYAKEATGDFTLTIEGIDFTSPNDDPDRAALTALYNATDGDNWHNNENWLTGAPLSEWHGVDTDDNGRVTRLDFEGNNLTGQIPTEFGDLVMLDWVNISINRLTGELPQSLTGLTQMEHLYFDTNAGLCAPADNVFQTWLQSIEYRGRTCGAPPPGSDEAALIALYNATDGDNWHRHDYWLTDAPLSEWYGVYVNGYGRVEELFLHENNLSGKIPPELAYLDNLRSIFFDNNRLTGEIPSELGKLQNLKGLILNNNQLTGTIPPELGNLGYLAYLELENNRLTGELPSELTQIGILQTLYFQNNAGLCASDNEEFQDWLQSVPHVRGDTCADRAALIALYNTTDGPNWTNNENWLTDVPLSEWHGVTTDENGRVTGLELTYNDLSGQMSPELDSLTNLNILDFSGNELEGEIPLWLVNLANLETLDLVANSFSGNIPPELAKLGNLQTLALGFNELAGEIPPEIGDFKNLTSLYLDVNNLSGEIPPELGSLTNLLSLSIGSNELTGEIPPEIGELANLELLRLGNNNLTGTIPPELAKLSNLRNLSLRRNELTGEVPPWIGELSNLEALGLHDNNLTGEIPAELANLTKLESLYLNYNYLSGDIPPELGALTNLTGLGLGGNNLTGEVPSEFGKLTKLEELDLSNNNLIGEVPAELSNLTDLNELYLNDNLLTGILPQGFISLNQLHDFYFDHNAGLCAPSDAVFQEWLRNADESKGKNCGVPTPPSDERDIAALTALYNAADGDNWERNRNWGSDLHPSEWYGVFTDADGRVTNIHLWSNNLSGHIPPELGNLTNLEVIELGSNMLVGELPPELGDLANLARLSLFDNLLSGEIPQRFTNLTSLNSFDFEDNVGLCAPADAAFQEWMQSVNNVYGPFCEDAPPPPASSECTQSISAGAPAQGQWTSNCVSTNRTEHGEYYAKYFTFTLDRPTTVEVLLESRTDSYILLLDSDGETVTQNDDYIYRNAGFLTALKPGEYTIEATTYSTQESGNFTLTVRQPELDALHALYNATGGANWDDSDNWLTGAPLSDWHGVKTDEDGRVIEIYLIGNNLSGEIPRELGDLGELQWLFLSRNGLSGSIPQELGNLYNLKILMLSNNELTGSIPARLGNMAALEELHLGRNRLSGSIPASLGRLENLRKLSLTVNDLSGSIPAELANLSDLRTLSIAANDLGGPIPYQLTDLENLTHIYLWGNDLSEGSFVRYLGDLESLQFLDIGGNDIDGAEVLAELDGLPNLTGLGLHDSDLTDTDLLRYMDDLQALNLEFINLSGNRLSDLQILVGLSRITTLQRIAINDNDFSGELPRTMTRLTLMRLFYFHDNDGLCAPDDSEFQDWLQGSPEIREFLRGGYPDVKGPTCTSGTTPANAPAPTSNGADQFAAVLQTPEQLVPPHSLSLLESIQPGG